MVILTDKISNAICEIAESIEYWENGYPFIPEKKLAYPNESVNVYETDNIPEEVEPLKWIYTEAGGFEINVNYSEPSPFDDPQYSAGYEQALLDLMELEFEEGEE